LFKEKETLPGAARCRTPQWSKEEVIAASKTFPTPISFFEMKDERVRYDLTPVPVPV
jgi:hypothetical protein